jgi:predicted lipoprotein
MRNVMRIIALLLTLLATPARADYPEVVERLILPGNAHFAAATQALADAARQSCDPATLTAPFNEAFDAWLQVAHFSFPPLEKDGRALAINFWPDPKALGTKAQLGLLTGDPALLAPETFAQQSVAARGFAGLERLLFPAEALPADPCPLIRATTADLARMAAEIVADWQGGFAQTVLTAGEPGNTTFLTRPEVRQVLYTQLYHGLEVLYDNRLGRPLGTFDRPRPERAESRASGRSLRNIDMSLRALRDLVAALTPDAPHTMAAFDHAILMAEALKDDPILAGVSAPPDRLKVEILQQAVDLIRIQVATELSVEMDVGIGFNAGDGD